MEVKKHLWILPAITVLILVGLNWVYMDDLEKQANDVINKLPSSEDKVASLVKIDSNISKLKYISIGIGGCILVLGIILGVFQIEK